jgi:chitodextrinase
MRPDQNAAQRHLQQPAASPEQRPRRLRVVARTVLLASALALVPSAVASEIAPPTAVAVTAATATSLTLSWSPPAGRKPAGYSLYVDGTRVASTAATTAVVGGLACGHGYTLGVASYNTRRVHSSTAQVAATTTSCPDTTPPSPPGSLSLATSTQTNVTLAWAASTDNVGVAGYRISLGGSAIATTTATSYTAGGLSCGSTYTFTVAAFDAAGNVSAPSSLTAPTQSCGPAAQIWVDTTGGTCSRLAAPVSYGPATDSAACSSLRGACAIAQGGDSVGVEAGAYPAAQNLPYRPQVASTVTFFPSGGTVLFQQSVCLGNDSSTRCDGVIDDPASWVSLDATAGNGTFVYQRGIQSIYRTRAATHIAVIGGHSAAGSSFDSVDTLTLRKLEIGPSCCTDDGLDLGWSAPGRPIVRNVTLDGLYIHDIARRCAAYPGPSADGIGSPLAGCADTTSHVDCIQLMGADTLTITGSRLYNCATQGIFLGGSGPAGGPEGSTCANTGVGCYAGPILIENNMIGAVYEAGSPLVIGRGATTPDPAFAPGTIVSVRYNSVLGTLSQVLSASPPDEVDYIGDIGGWPSWVPCNQQPGVQYVFSHNVLTARTCSSSDYLESTLANEFVALGALGTDLSLRRGAPAINRGDPALFPPSDIAGTRRPVNGLPDAGAEEAG